MLCMYEGIPFLMQDYGKAKTILEEFDRSSEKGRNWDLFVQLLGDLV